LSRPPAVFIANALTNPTGARGRKSSSQRRARITVVSRNNRIIRKSGAQL
jgi:hypothetical protein